MPKPFLTYEQQLVKLRDEKCIVIENESMTLSKLQQVGYYSLVSGYKHLFRIPAQKTYKGGTTFREIVALYEFDESLRELFLHYLLHTPVEVVDFIIQSVEYVMQQRFGRSISDKGVHVLDPFTGTGTFIVRLLRSGIIKPEDLLYKYTSEIHCNEIVLLAYYIAAVNIEETYHELSQSEDYVPFEGIVLTDTFELAERSGTREGEADTSIFQLNTDRAAKQMQTPIQVIIGIILTPILMSILSSENAQRFNQSKTYFTLDLLIGWHSTLLRVSRP